MPYTALYHETYYRAYIFYSSFIHIVHTDIFHLHFSFLFYWLAQFRVNVEFEEFKFFFIFNRQFSQSFL